MYYDFKIKNDEKIFKFNDACLYDTADGMYV